MTTPQQASFPAKQREAVTLVALANAVPLARRLVGEVARHWHLPEELTGDNALIVSELVTNALAATESFHAARGMPVIGRIRLRLRWNRPSLFTEVWDINPLLPIRREAGADDTSGRGLGIIDVLCVQWAAFHCLEGGKVVWTEQRLS